MAAGTEEGGPLAGGGDTNGLGSSVSISAGKCYGGIFVANLSVGWRLRKHSGYRRLRLLAVWVWVWVRVWVSCRCCTGLICLRYELSCLMVFSTNVMSMAFRNEHMSIGVFLITWAARVLTWMCFFIDEEVISSWYRQCISRFTYNLLLYSQFVIASCV